MSRRAPNLTLATILLGFPLVVVSLFWSSIVGGRRAWTDDQAKAFTEAAGELHRLTYEAAEAQQRAQQTANGNAKGPMSQTRLSPEAGAPSDPSETLERKAQQTAAKLAIARERFAQQRAALDDARSHGQSAAAVLRWAGISLIAIGLVSWLIGRSDSQN